MQQGAARGGPVALRPSFHGQQSAADNTAVLGLYRVAVKGKQNKLEEASTHKSAKPTLAVFLCLMILTFKLLTPK